MTLARVALIASIAVLGCSGKKEQKSKQVPDAGAAEETVRLDPFWDSPAYLKLADEKACPDGMWALFPGEPPGQDDAEKKANQARRTELAQRLKDATFVTQLYDVKLGEYESGKGTIPIEVKGSVDCTDSIGRVTISFTAAQPELPEGRSFGQWYWKAPPLTYERAVKMSEASTFKRTHRAGLDARIVFKLGKTEVHKKIERIEESAEERAERLKHDIPGGGGIEDWGAGRMVKGELQGVRVASDKSRNVLMEQKK